MTDYYPKADRVDLTEALGHRPGYEPQLTVDQECAAIAGAVVVLLVIVGGITGLIYLFS